MDRVVVGMVPHKASVTIEARDTRKVLRARGRFGTDKRNYAQMLRTAGSGRAGLSNRWRDLRNVGGVRLSRGVRGGDH
jgi:hypothetical protein